MELGRDRWLGIPTLWFRALVLLCGMTSQMGGKELRIGFSPRTCEATQLKGPASMVIEVLSVDVKASM